MNDAVFGEAPELERDARLKVQWPLRALNQIEWQLITACGEEESRQAWRAPVLYIDGEDGSWNAADYLELYGEVFTLSEAIEMQNIVHGDVRENFRRQIIIARECGESATLEDYKAACAAEQINPLLERIKL
jgi:hypothetical protein